MINFVDKHCKFFTKIALVFIVLVGIIEYTKIGLSLISGTYTKSFIHVSPFSIGAGEVDSLPPEVLNIKTLSIRNNIKTFRLRFFSYDESAKLFIIARALEFLYPIKIDPSSKYLFVIGEHSAADACRKIDQLNHTTLYECAN